MSLDEATSRTRTLARGVRPRDPGGPARGWRERIAWALRQLPGALVVVGVGVLLGQQYWTPNKRVLPVIAAVLAIGVAWRMDILSALGLLVLALPYPKGTVFGNTNLALILLVVIIWFVRASLGMAARPRRSPLDLPLIGLVTVYICSFYNVHDAEAMSSGIRNFELMIGSLVMFYLIVANLNSPRALERMITFQLISALTVFALAVYELFHPGSWFIGQWIDLGAMQGRSGEINAHNLRIGSTFGDYELLSEYCVLTLMPALFLWIRSDSATRRTLLTGFIVLDVFVLFATVTRGAIISGGIGLLVLLWLTRRRVNFVMLTSVVALVVASFLGMNFFVSSFTTSGSVVARLGKTTFENGWIPDSRVGAWNLAWTRIMIHPLLGSGPAYMTIFPMPFTWPHNVYLYYASIVGAVGLGFYLWILARFEKLTRPSSDSFRHPDFARAYSVVTRVQFVVFVVNELKIDYLRNPIYQMLVWVMFSVWTATALIVREQAAAQAPTQLARRAA